MSTSLLAKQKAAVLKVLSLNADVPADGWATSWKILIHDIPSRDMVALLLKVADLRRQGVTLNLLLNQPRKPVLDVDAVYIIQPSEESVQRVCEDFAAHLYSKYHLNFTSSLPRVLLEKLAESALESDCVADVKLYDQQLNFLSLEPDLFSLNMQDTFHSLLAAQEKSDVDSIVRRVVDQLYCVLSTMCVVPIIRCQRRGAAEEVAIQLDSRIRAALSGGELSFEASLNRPVLILFDRDLDLAVCVKHPWTYQALTHDLLTLKLNKVRVRPADRNEDGTPKAIAEYDLDVTDKLWTMTADCALPTAAEKLDAELRAYREDSDRIRERTQGETRQLKDAMDSLPEMQQRKANIDKHMAIATFLMDQIKQRDLHLLFAAEDRLITRNAADKSELLAQMAKASKDDQLRTYLVYFICTGNADAAMEKQLLESGVDMMIVQSVKKLRMSSTIQTQIAAPAPKYALGSLVSEWAEKIATSQTLSTFTTAIKSVMPAQTLTPVTRAVEAILDPKPSTDNDEFRYFDPKASSQTRYTGVLRQAIVFVVGGGTYAELTNLREWSKASHGRSIVFGSTEIVNAAQFISQLTRSPPVVSQ
eukprot:TRINITY_DN1860_c0_g1_i1.p1 TRINITY_DN1860_c0_g1~~TRINITY_DN1860_c0_g1_i1.p1  ORF type:complete len:590 (+),score=94.54 TRINITY_DN1860_c0_g1_i1:116-1885(+)